jgi:hypothetical protein
MTTRHCYCAKVYTIPDRLVDIVWSPMCEIHERPAPRLEVPKPSDPLADFSVERAWAGVRELLESQGEDPDELLRRAAANVEAWRKREPEPV